MRKLLNILTALFILGLIITSSWGGGNLRAEAESVSSEVYNPYNLPLEKIAQALPIENGVTVDNILDQERTSQWYKLEIDKDSKVEFELQVPQTMNGVIIIYDSNLDFVQTIDLAATGAKETGNAYLQGPGTYFVTVYDALGKTQQDYYQFRVSFGETQLNKDHWEPNDIKASAKEIQLEEEVTANFMPSSDIDIYKVQVWTQGDLEISLDIPKDVDGSILLFDENFSDPSDFSQALKFADREWTGKGEKLIYTISAPGTYYIVVGDFFGTAAPESYTLQTQLAPTIPKRLAGPNRYETAIQMAKAGWPDGSEVVVLARGDNFADALAGAPLAYKFDAPVLLTHPKSLDPKVLAEINRLNPSKIIILGGQGAISKEIELSLTEDFAVERIAGTSRFETAAEIAYLVGSNGKAVIAYGYNFPDALAVSSLAASRGIPILLTGTDKLDIATEDILSYLGVEETIVIGGERIISPAVEKALPNAKRIAGSNRYQTAVEVIKYFGVDSARFFVASGLNYPDALAGSALAAKKGAPIILTDPNSLPLAVKGLITELKSKWTSPIYHFLGGEGAVSTKITNSF